MKPELFHIGRFTVYSYGLFIFIGLILAFLFLRKEWKKIGLGSEDVIEVFFWSIIGVVLGGKVFYFLERPGYFINNPGAFFKDFGSGFVFYGSFLTVIPILTLLFRKLKLNPWEQFDLVGICGAFVHAFGKLGCFMAGCCYGKVCERSFYSVVFTDPKSLASPLKQNLYATQIWDSLIIFSIIAIMFFLKSRKQFHGQLFLVYAILYATGRYFTENFRGDEQRGFLFNGLLSHSQFIALMIIIFSLVIYVYRNTGSTFVQSARPKKMKPFK